MAWVFDPSIDGAIDWRTRKREEFDEVWGVYETISGVFEAIKLHPYDNWHLVYDSSNYFDNYWKARAYMQKMNEGKT